MKRLIILWNNYEKNIEFRMLDSESFFFSLFFHLLLFKNRLKFKKLINGYRQFDPTRGTHYIMDLALTDQKRIEYIKRAELMRPLGKLIAF